jgi:hypothetical protein
MKIEVPKTKQYTLFTVIAQNDKKTKNIPLLMMVIGLAQLIVQLCSTA